MDDNYIDLLKKCLTASIYDESSWMVLQAKPAIGQMPPERFLQPVRTLFRRWLINWLRKRNLLLIYKHPFNPVARSEGADWPCFGYTMAGLKRLNNLQMCIENVIRTGCLGDIVETGVWRGGSMIFARALLKANDVTDRKVWLADSFEGMPIPHSETDGANMSDVEVLCVSLEQVKANFEKFGLLDDQVRFLRGWFSDTLPSAPINQIAVLRLDGDLYHSTMDSLRNLYHRVSPGGYVIVDDYGGWPACKQAVTDFLQERRINVTIHSVDYSCVYWQVGSSQVPPAKLVA